MRFDEAIREAATMHREQAIEAAAMVADWLGVERLPSTNSGSDTFIRCAWRLYHGATVEEAAAREYAYRWHLPLNQWVNHAEAGSRSKPITGAWPVPHLIGL